MPPEVSASAEEKVKRVRADDRLGMAANSRPEFVGEPRYGELDDGTLMVGWRSMSSAGFRRDVWAAGCRQRISERLLVCCSRRSRM